MNQKNWDALRPGQFFFNEHNALYLKTSCKVASLVHFSTCYDYAQLNFSEVNKVDITDLGIVRATNETSKYSVITKNFEKQVTVLPGEVVSLQDVKEIIDELQTLDKKIPVKG